jgi:hypothetical protein
VGSGCACKRGVHVSGNTSIQNVVWEVPGCIETTARRIDRKCRRRALAQGVNQMRQRKPCVLSISCVGLGLGKRWLGRVNRIGGREREDTVNHDQDSDIRHVETT